MDEKTLKRANALAFTIEWYKEVIHELERPESKILVGAYVGVKNLGSQKKIKAPLIRLYKRRLAKAQKELELL